MSKNDMWFWGLIAVGAYFLYHQSQVSAVTPPAPPPPGTPVTSTPPTTPPTSMGWYGV